MYAGHTWVLLYHDCINVKKIGQTDKCIETRPIILCSTLRKWPI